MARGKVTTSEALKNERDSLQAKNSKLEQRNDMLLQRIGGLRAHIIQNNVEAEEIARLLERILLDS